jgi:peptidoglycan/LPS O-acetylase OafA/YrhL
MSGLGRAPGRGGRIEFLDGLRGLAVLAVVLWHAYGPTYAAFFPYGDHYSQTVAPVRVLWLGVQLFFLISGFVILMTLERCRSLKEFAVRRWLRLFPAMAIVSIAIFLFDRTVAQGPYVARSAADLLPGLLFLDPSLIHALSGVTLQSMDGPFWSLYVEVIFYVVFGAAYFIAGTNAAIGTLAGCFGAAYLAELAVNVGHVGGLFARIAGAFGWLGLIQFGWFASGAIFYRYHQTRDRRALALAIAVALVCVFTSHPAAPNRYGIIERVGLLSVVLLFTAAVVSRRVQGWLSLKPLLFLGFVSYPLYLFHNNVMVGLIQWLGARAPGIPRALLPALPMLFVGVVAWAIARHGEPRLRMALARMGRALVPGRGARPGGAVT